jgi:hypothetical protein
MQLFELIIDSPEDEVFALSLVSNPAIELDGVYFNKEKVEFKEIDKEQGLFVAPILTPNKRILRVDGEGKPYAVYFSPETVKKLSQLYLERKYQDRITEEHEKDVENVVLIESWIKESNVKDKSLLYHLGGPIGTWYGTFRIQNEEIREKFRSGELKAISIEGVFEHLQREDVKMSNIMLKEIDDLTEEEAKELLNTIHSMLMPGVELEQPSIASTYPGEVSGSISEATL